MLCCRAIEQSTENRLDTDRLKAVSPKPRADWDLSASDTLALDHTVLGKLGTVSAFQENIEAILDDAQAGSVLLMIGAKGGYYLPSVLGSVGSCVLGTDATAISGLAYPQSTGPLARWDYFCQFLVG